MGERVGMSGCVEVYLCTCMCACRGSSDFLGEGFQAWPRMERVRRAGRKGREGTPDPAVSCSPWPKCRLFTSSNLSKKPVKPKNKVSAHALLNVYVQEHESPYTSPYTQLWRDVCVYTNDRNRQRGGGERFRPPSYPFLRCM